MIERNVVQVTFDEFGKSLGASKKSGSWYRRGTDTIFVLNLQKSQYGASYYLNLGLWFLAVSDIAAPKSASCHVVNRLGRLAPESNDLLDLTVQLDEVTRSAKITEVFKSIVEPISDASLTLEGLRSGVGLQFIRSSGITGEGQRVLREAGIDLSSPV
jgi:hypothetical protein